MAGVNANQVYASGFPNSTNESDLYLFFGSYGEVTTVKLLINKKKSALIGAFITFRDCRCAEMVLEDQKRRQMFFKGAKIHVREAYVDKQSVRGSGSGMTSAPARDTDYRQGFRSERIDRQESSYGGGNYNKNYSDDRSTSYQSSSSGQNPFLQSSIFSSSTRSGDTMSDNRSGGQYSNYAGGNVTSSSGGYGTDRREDNYSQNYSSGNRGQGYDDNYRSQSGYNRQDNTSMDTSRRFDDTNRSSNYRDGYNQTSSRVEGSLSGGNANYSQGGQGSGSWADIMDNEDRFSDRNRSYDNRSRDVSINESYNRDSGMGMNRDSYVQDNRSGTGGYDRYGWDGPGNTDRQVQQDRPMQSGQYSEGGRYQEQSRDRGYNDGGMSQQGNYGRDQDRYEDRDNRKRGSEWVGGYDASPRKQMAMSGRDDRPTGFQPPRDEQFHSMDNMSRNTGSFREEPMSRGPAATSTPRDGRGFEPSGRDGRAMTSRGDQDYRRDNFNRGRDDRDERNRKSGFVGGPDRKYRTTEREARGGARRESPRRMAGNGPNFRQQPIDQDRQQHGDSRRGNLDGGMREQDRRGWVGGGSLDQQPSSLMGGNRSPPRGGMHNRGDGQGFQGGMNQEQMRLMQQQQQQQQQRQQMEMEMQMRQQQLQQQRQQEMQMQMEMQRRQQQQQQQREMQMRQQQMQQQQSGPMAGAQGGNMQGIMSTLAQLLQNLTKGRSNQQRQIQPDLMRQLNRMEREVINEVKRSLRVDETPLFASAIVMMRPMDDGVIKLFTQLPQGILMKILRGASPDEVAKALSEVPRTKTYDNRDEARFHVLRKLLIVLYKVSRETGTIRPVGPVRPVVAPRDFSRQRLMLARRRLAVRGARTEFKRPGDEKRPDDKKVGEKKEEKSGGMTTRTAGRGGFRTGFRDGFRGRGGFRGMRRGMVSSRGRGIGRAGTKTNGAVKKTEAKTSTTTATSVTTTAATKTTATTKKPEAAKKTTETTVKKSVAGNTPKKTVTTPTAKKPAVVKKTPTPTGKKATPVKTTPVKTTPNKTPTRKSTS